jgi:lipopolysaccharide export system protein LptA
MLLVLLILAQVAPNPDAGLLDGFNQPLQVTADHLQVQGKAKQATWTGHVHATRGTTQMQCQKLVAHYQNAEVVTRLECTGNVEVVDGDKWARGERADFDNTTGLLVVTGHPEAREGKNYMRGERILLDVTKDTMEVERARSILETKQGAPTLPTKNAPSAPRAGKP